MSFHEYEMQSQEFEDAITEIGWFCFDNTNKIHNDFIKSYMDLKRCDCVENRIKYHDCIDKLMESL